jgi:integrase
MIERGELPSFRLGSKLIRILGEEVEAYECTNGASQNFATNIASPGTTATSADVIDLGHAIRRRRPASPRLDIQSLRAPRGKTVKDLWDGYLLDMHGRAVTGTMTHTWKALRDRFAKMDAEAISIADCRAHTAERRRAGIKDGTIHTELGHLRMVLLWALKNKLVASAPHIERPAKPEPKDVHLTRVEVRGMIDAAKAHHIRLAIMLMVGTGARNEAALQLTWLRVDFARRMIQLRDPFDKARRKGRASVPINDALLEALEVAKKGALSPFVIEWAGNKVASIKKGLKAAGKAIGRPDVSPHMLRHSAAVWLAEDGHSMDEIAQYLGHGNSRITAKVYARFSPTHLRKLADSLNT